jgi:hypothetical protein
MPRNDAAALNHVCPGIHIHVIVMVQPPGINIEGMDDIDLHQAMVPAALATNNAVATVTNARSDA